MESKVYLDAQTYLRDGWRLARQILDSGWRLVLVVLMYVYAIAGMDFVMAPYHGRDAIAWATAKPARFAAIGAVFAVVGLVVLLLPALI